MTFTRGVRVGKGTKDSGRPRKFGRNRTKEVYTLSQLSLLMMMNSDDTFNLLDYIPFTCLFLDRVVFNSNKIFRYMIIEKVGLETGVE